MENIVEVEKLVKRFNGLTAVDQVSFSIPEAELFGLLGPNGAGKTTIINILATLLKPSGGDARVAGVSVLNDRDYVRRQIGVVFQDQALDGKLSARENLVFHSMMYGMKPAEYRPRISEMLELVGLADKADILAEKYSGGMKRRLEIARGLLHRPRVLFLDEPTQGLDAQTRRQIWSHIKRINQEEHVTMILTTHYLEEADHLCQRVAIIDRGRIVALDTPASLKDSLGGDLLTLETAADRTAFLDHLPEIPWIRDYREERGGLLLTLDQAERHIPELLDLARAAKMEVQSVKLHKPGLEDVFLHFTGTEIRPEDDFHEGHFFYLRNRSGN